MPLKRTPPNSPAVPPQDSDVSHLQQSVTPGLIALLKPSSSDLDICGSSASDAYCPDDKNVSRRPKRKRTETLDPHFISFMTEMKNLFADFKESQNHQLEKLFSSVEELKAQNSDIKSSLEFLNEKYNILESQLSDLKAENLKKAEHLRSLEDKIGKMERNARATCLEIKNIPVNKTESKTSLLRIVSELGNTMNISVQSHDVKDIFRVNSKNPEYKTIIVDLASVITKENLLSSYKKFNRGTRKLSTEYLKLGGPIKRIFISENLTAQMKRLHYITRVFANSNGYKYCWIAGGKIFIREKDGVPHFLIRDEADLKNIPKKQ